MLTDSTRLLLIVEALAVHRTLASTPWLVIMPEALTQGVRSLPGGTMMPGGVLYAKEVYKIVSGEGGERKEKAFLNFLWERSAGSSFT